MREMRRFKQALTPGQCGEILERGTFGVLAAAGDEGWPYAVPLSYVWRDGKVYFHCAAAGHKVDAIRADSRVSFCVVDRNQIVPEEYTTYYRSVIAFGQAEIVDDPREQYDAMLALAEKYCASDTPAHREEKSTDTQGYTAVIRLTIEHLTGKEGKALAQQRSSTLEAHA